MVTVYQVVKAYTAENKLPEFTRRELSEIGQFIAHHFKQYWGLVQPDEIIAQAGFIRTNEEGEMMIVVGYPFSFKREMINRVGVFLALQKKKMDENAERTRLHLERERLAAEKKLQKLNGIAKESKRLHDAADGMKKRKRIPLKQSQQS